MKVFVCEKINDWVIDVGCFGEYCWESSSNKWKVGWKEGCVEGNDCVWSLCSEEFNEYK